MARSELASGPAEVDFGDNRGISVFHGNDFRVRGPGEREFCHGFPGTSLDHQHNAVRTALKLAEDFVLHSLRRTMLTRLGEAGADAFPIMRIAGRSSGRTLQRYVHPTPEGGDRAFERLQKFNEGKAGIAEMERLGP